MTGCRWCCALGLLAVSMIGSPLTAQTSAGLPRSRSLSVAADDLR